MGGHSMRLLNQIKNIAVHYSATASGDTSAFERHWKNNNKWNTGGYHEVVLLNGNVELNYDANVISNGVGGQNTRMYNICYVGNGQPNAAQLKSLIERVNYNRNRFNLTVNDVKGHREFSGQSTACPSLNMTNFRKSLSDEIVKGGNNQMGLVDWMNSKGMDSSYSNRARLANQHEISNYSGTATQNMQLLAKLKADSTKIETPKVSAKLNHIPSAAHKDAWNKATAKGILNGKNPYDPVSREQLATILDRVGMLD